MSLVLDLLSVLAIVSGAFFYLAGTVGLLRFPDAYTRLHALTKADNLGLALVVLGLLLIWRPLLFASVDADVAAARGVPTWGLSLVFMVLLGLAVAVSVQIVGALLVLSVLVTPAAAALRISSSPVLVPVLSVVFAVTSMVGGIMLALGGSIPISPYVTTISFLIFVVCLVISKIRGRARATA